MSIKTVLAIVFAFLVGIGGTSAYFYFQKLDNILNAPVPSAQTEKVKTDEVPSDVPPSVPPLQKITPVNKGSLKQEELVIGGVSYGMSVDSVKATHGEPNEIENKHKWRGSMYASIYEYPALFKLYITDGVIRGIKVDRPNGITTNRNIGVGNTVNDVLAAYGEPNRRSKDKIVYLAENNSEIGIEFEIDNGYVEEIRVGLLK